MKKQLLIIAIFGLSMAGVAGAMNQQTLEENVKHQQNIIRGQEKRIKEYNLIKKEIFDKYIKGIKNHDHAKKKYFFKYINAVKKIETLFEKNKTIVKNGTIFKYGKRPEKIDEILTFYKNLSPNRKLEEDANNFAGYDHLDKEVSIMVQNNQKPLARVASLGIW